MNLETISHFLLASLLIHWVLLALWVGLLTLAKPWLFRVHTRWLPMEEKHFNIIHYAAIAFYKVLIFIFNLVPLLVIHFVLL